MALSLLLLWVVVLGSNHLTTLPLSVQGNGSPRHDHRGAQMDAPLQENPIIRSRNPSTTAINCQTRPREKLSPMEQPKSSFKKWLRQRMRPGSTPAEKKHNNRSDLAAYHHEYATVSTRGRITSHGAQALIGIWQPSVEREEEISLARMRVAAGNDTIEIGWEVYPRCHNGNTEPHLYVHMTNDSYNHVNCLNTFCHDTFRRHKDDRFLGQSLNAPVMHRTQRRFFLEKLSNGDWRARLGISEHEYGLPRSPEFLEVGYWPAGVLPSLSHGATQVEWGGEIIYPSAYGSRDDYDGVLLPVRHTKTQMGNGRFAGQKDEKAAEFTNPIYKKGEKGQYLGLSASQLTKHVTDGNCYNLVFRPQTGHDQSGLFFGGPGYGPNCQNPLLAAA